MKPMPSTELVRTIGKVFTRVQRGESILVTHRGEPYAVLRPVTAEEITQYEQDREAAGG
jgi:prevent-host-death family protein